MTQFINLLPGDPAPTFHQRSLKNPRFAFDTAAGRYLVLCFFGSLSGDHAREAVAAASAWPNLFDDSFASFFGVTIDPADEAPGRLTERVPGIRHFLDFDRLISRQYGASPLGDEAAASSVLYNPRWVILSPNLRVIGVFPFEANRSDITRVHAFLSALPKPELSAGIALQAPILFLPNVLEQDLCDRLIGLYRKHGGTESGFMREVNGVTTAVYDHAHKRRRDYIIDDKDLIATLQERVKRRLVPEIKKAHQFTITRMERYIVACYTAEDAGHFRAHRDNTTKGTAHRRFAVSINLNREFEGGEI